MELIEQADDKLNATVLEISKVVLAPVSQSLKTIVSLGLGYLNLDRAVASLSGGERQRVALAGQLSSHLFGVTYVLDEPTLGLDEKQVAVLSKALKRIVANGNTVVVVEHDESFIRNADYIIEMGPGAGRQGGQLIYQGKVTDIVKVKNTVTYKLLEKNKAIPNQKQHKKGNVFGIKGAISNNLKDIDVEFYACQITAVSGVSGSGKSSLIKDVLYNSWLKHRAVNCASVYGLEQFDEVLLIDQEVLTQNRMSTLVTYTGIIEQIKAVFSKTELAKQLGLKKADFSYQSKNGKCTTCGGHGKLKTSMDFMSDIWLTCDSCKGMRYNETVLDCKFNELSIGEVLGLTVQEAIVFFEDKTIVAHLTILKQVGVGHLILGQAGNTLSGGEAQRLKLANSMLPTSTRLSTGAQKGAILYLFDEPSTGLHYFDILPLIKVFQSLINRGDTVLFIEHNTTLIESADRVITLGPGSGDEGGFLMN